MPFTIAEKKIILETAYVFLKEEYDKT